jgi:hypothetical protein
MATDLKVPSESSFKYIPLASLIFVFDQAEKRLKDSLEASDNLTNRSYNFLTLSIGIFVALCGYIITSLSNEERNNPLLITAFFSSAYIIVIFVSLIKNIAPSFYKGAGAEPRFLYKDEMLVPQETTEERIELKQKFLYDSEIVETQTKITENIERNILKGARLRFCIKALFWLPIIAAIIFSISLLCC